MSQSANIERVDNGWIVVNHSAPKNGDRQVFVSLEGALKRVAEIVDDYGFVHARIESVMVKREAK